MAKEFSVNSFYESGKYFYQNGQKLEDNEASPAQIRGSYGLAAKNMWMAFSLGHLQAPYSFSVFFNQGVGVKQNDYVAKLLFGVALKLGDEKCLWKTNQQEVPNHMNEAVQELTNLIKATNLEIPSDMEVSIELVNSQMEIFDNFIVLPDGHTIVDLLLRDKTSENIEYEYPQDHDSHLHQQDYAIEVGGASQPSSDSDCCCIIL